MPYLEIVEKCGTRSSGEFYLQQPNRMHLMSIPVPGVHLKECCVALQSTAWRAIDSVCYRQARYWSGLQASGMGLSSSLAHVSRTEPPRHCYRNPAWTRDQNHAALLFRVWTFKKLRDIYINKESIELQRWGHALPCNSKHMCVCMHVHM